MDLAGRANLRIGADLLPASLRQLHWRRSGQVFFSTGLLLENPYHLIHHRLETRGKLRNLAVPCPHFFTT